MSLNTNYQYNKEDESEKVFFAPGDLVTIKHDIPNKPIMLVKNKEQALVKNNSFNDHNGVSVTHTNGGNVDSHFRGMRCFWFTKDFELQEAVFNTKDLQKL